MKGKKGNAAAPKAAKCEKKCENKCDKKCDEGRCGCGLRAVRLDPGSPMGKGIVDGLSKLAEKYREMLHSLDPVAHFLLREAEKLEEKARAIADSAKPSEDAVRAVPSLFDMLLSSSKYDFSGIDVKVRRNTGLDSDGRMAYDVSLFKTTESKVDGKARMTSVTEEGTVVFVYPDMKRTVDEFDGKIGAFTFCRPPLKERRAQPQIAPLPVKANPYRYVMKTMLKPVDKKACEKVKKAAKAAKPDKAKKAKVVPVIDDLKRTVLECSGYAVPSSRVRFVAYRVDPKHGNFVYEVRFYQKSTKSVPAEKQSYEPAYLNVRMHGDRDDLIAKRFDRIVEGLRFNEFKRKAD